MATIVITPTEFTVGNDVIINGIIDDESVSKIDVNGSVIDLTGSEFSLNLGQLTAQAYALPITILDGDSAGETTEINFTVSAETETPGGETGGSTEPTEPTTHEAPEAPASNVITDDGKYTGVTEHGAALEGQEFYNKIMEDFDSNKFIPDYIPNKKMPNVDSIKTTLGGDPLYVPIETLAQRFPERRNLTDVHGALFGEMYHPDMIDKVNPLVPIEAVVNLSTSLIGVSLLSIISG
jgi:hypothetical protein